MKTARTYYDDVYLSKSQSRIVECLPCPEDGRDMLLVLDSTIFFPTGGGQSCDLGSINGHPVVDVYEHQDEIYHRVSGGKTLCEDGTLSPGMTVDLSIDWERRFDNMQRHCGEHILSGVFFKLYGGVNRGFHMGDDYLTIDISLEENPEYTELDMEMCLQAEKMANEIIWKDLPVTRHVYETKEEAEKMPLRKALSIEKDISIVTVGVENDPADSVACCGTHPTTSGQVGMVKIYKVEPNKGMFRVFFEAGARALKAYDQQYELLSKLGKDLSAGVPDLWDKYLARQEKNVQTRDLLYKITKEVIAREAASLEHELLSGTSVKREYSILTPDNVIEIGRSLSDKIPALLYLIHTEDLTVFMFSDKYDCGKMVKENAAVFSGKGGGNKTFARAIFERRDDLDSFIGAMDMLIR